MIFTITASYGQYEDRCEATMYVCAELDEARKVMADLKRDISAALSTIALVGHDAVSHCEEPVWELAKSASWDGEVHLGISCMVMGQVSSGADFIEGEWATSAYNGDISYDMIVDAGLPSKYELLARPYEMKYFGERIH
jgi:hypothetical protein